MPYFIYNVHTTAGLAIKQLEKVGQFPTFKEASTEAKRLRADPELAAGCAVKVIFAENELQAEDLLSQVREPEPMIGDDY
jgi:hypothetical protein